MWLSDVDFVLPRPGRWPNSVVELHLNGMQNWETHREPLSKEDMLPSRGVCWHLQGLLQLLRTSSLEIKPFLRQLTSNK